LFIYVHNSPAAIGRAVVFYIGGKTCTLGTSLYKLVACVLAETKCKTCSIVLLLLNGANATTATWMLLRPAHHSKKGYRVAVGAKGLFLTSNKVTMQQRNYALDVFRGATVALMILVNNPGTWSAIYAPLDHAEWHGCTPTDLVFPFFLFAVGNALAFVMPKFVQMGSGFFAQKVVKRTILIFVIGLLLNWSPFVKWDNDVLVSKPWEMVRIMGVLQRIAICYGVAAVLVFWLSHRMAMIAAAVILLAYWGMCYGLGNGAEPYTLKGYFGVSIDSWLLGINHLYKGEGVPFDPEGIASTPAAMVEVMFGYFAGAYIKQKGSTYEMLVHLFLAGVLCLFVGYCWDMVFPINKKIWTSSYTVYTSGLALLVLSVLIYVLEIQQWKGVWSKFFDVFGKNPLFIFVLSGLLPRLLGLIRLSHGVDVATGKPLYISPFGWWYHTVCKPLSADLRLGSLVYALTMIGFYWLIVYVMDKRKIYVKV